jgi:hypothetical protein
VSEGPDTGPVAAQAPRPGRPAAPRAVPLPPEGDAGRHRTEQAPVPLPPATAAQDPVAGPATGQLDLGGYPPRVPGPRPSGPREEDDGAGDDR